MSTTGVTLHHVVGTLQAEGLLGGEGPAYFENQVQLQPWYLRAMVGFGAWLASLLLIGFVAGFALSLDTGYAFIGLALIAGAVMLRRRSHNDFLAQCAFAASLAGQALAAYGFAETVGQEEAEIFLGVVLVLSSALFFLFPDRIHRVLMVLLATGSLTTLFYFWEMNALVPLLGPVFTGLLIALYRQRPFLVASRFATLLRPLTDGVLLSAFGALSISTVYVLPELGLDHQFYPRPWLSTILLGCLFLYVGTSIWPTVTPPGNRMAPPWLYGLMFIVVVCAWAAPGLLLGLIVAMLGAESGHKTLAGAGIGFLVFFLATYFYGIEVTMLTKSMVLVATGIAILASRWAILRLAAANGQGGSHGV